jgi:putative DNA primase/helicase
MDKLDVQEFKERSILMGMVYSTEYLKKVKDIWDGGKYIIAPEILKIGDWCIKYLDVNKAAPGPDADNVWIKDDSLSKAEAQLLENDVIRIEQEWQRRQGEFNVAYHYEETVKHFQTVAAEQLKDNIDEHLERGELEKAKTLVREHKAPGDTTKWRSADQIKLRSVYWHWEDAVPREELVVIAGFKGLGKSQLLCSIAAIASMGGRWPNGQESKAERDIILISAEDNPDSVLGPRLVAAGANMRRCYIPNELPETTDQAVTLIEQLLDTLPNKGRGAIVGMDPITAYMGSKDSNSVVHVRSTLRPFVEMGHRRKVTVICIHHLTKAMDSKSALDLVLGSGGFVHAPRVVHLVFPDPRRKGWNLLLSGANNIGAMHPGYAYQIVPETVKGTINTSRIFWQTDLVNMNADEVLGLLRQAKSRPKTEDAKAWLKEFLSNGPVQQHKIQEAAEEMGFNWSTIRVAKTELRVRSERQGGRNGGWVWKLPTEQ